MPTISTLGYGTSSKGVQSLLDEIRSDLIDTVSNNAGDISTIETACNENWEGTSKEVFLSNLKKDVKMLQEGLDQMYNALGKEINAASAAILDFDQNLIQEN